MKKLSVLFILFLGIYSIGKSQSGSPTCLNMPGICVNAIYALDGTTANNTAQLLNPGNNYVCLGATPSPNWFFMRVTQSGNLNFTISASMDIDFILYGPFNSIFDIESQCNTFGQPGSAPVIGCSFSSAATEFVSIPNGQYGEYYVILITNFSGIYQSVTFAQTGGSGTIACNANTTVSGTVYGDLNSDCILDSTDQPMPFMVLHNITYNFYGNTDAYGNYTFSSDTGTVEIEQIIPVGLQPLVTPLCPAPPAHQTTYVPTDSSHITDVNFANEIISCPALEVEMTTTPRRLCFNGHTDIEYCNIGFADTSNVELVVDMPDYVIVTSATQPYSINSDGNLVFVIGTLNAGDCGTLIIYDSVACDINLLGLTQCTAAWMDPGNGCLENLDPDITSWDHSSVSVEGECVGDSLACFTIYNTGDPGSGDMQGTSEYRIYENNVLVFTGTFQIDGGDSVVFCWPTNGNTIRLEANQRPGHPGNSHPNDHVENCGENFSGQTVLNQILPAPIDDLDLIIDEDCALIIASYDPNFKAVSPAGFGVDHRVDPDMPLEYEVHFQNTGSDTAFNIMVVDTLSPYLDIATLTIGNASHLFDLEITGQNRVVLKFKFNDIMLPDSTTDLEGSQGFFTYSIAPLPNLPLGTQIHNYADIYFDFNPPVATNNAWITYDLGGKVTSDNTEEALHADLYPNPTNGRVFINSGTYRIEQITVADPSGKIVAEYKIGKNTAEIDLSELAGGIYLLDILTTQGHIIKKVIRE